MSSIFNNLILLLRPVLINAFVSFERGHVKSENWGDDINWYFLREVSRRPILIYNQVSLAFRLNLRNYLVIGSTIDMLCKKNTEVWGAGIIKEDSILSIKPSKVYAVRGPLTRKVLLMQGVECPEVYGDPALLISKYYHPKMTKKYKYGIISHVSNLEEINTMTFDGIALSEREDVLLINLSSFDKWTDILDKICSCQCILSASLHGLIISESYGIPNVWIEFGKPLIGGHFKFHDFFLSIGQDRANPLIVKNNILDCRRVELALSEWKPGNINLKPLIESCPFKIKLD